MISHSRYLDNNLDFWEIRDLLVDNFARKWKFDIWDFCRLETWRYRIHSLIIRKDPDFLSGLAELWRDESGKLIGVAISEYGKNDIFIFSRFGFEFIEQEILEWIDKQWLPDRDRVETFCNSEDKEKKSLLTKFGYAFKESAGHAYKYDLNQVQLDYTLEAGYKVQDITEDRNFEGRAEAIFLSFNPDKAFDKTRLPYWESTRGAPGYRPRLELAVVSSEGQVCSGCLGWVDLINREGAVEPIGTHPSFQRRGFGRAMVTECFKRMKEIGLINAFIGSGPEPAVGNRLYQSLNPEEKVTDEIWEKMHT